MLSRWNDENFKYLLKFNRFIAREIYNFLLEKKTTYIPLSFISIPKRPKIENFIWFSLATWTEFRYYAFFYDKKSLKKKEFWSPAFHFALLSWWIFDSFLTT